MATASEADTSIEEKRGQVINRPFLERAWSLVRKSLTEQHMSENNIEVLEHTYVHWFKHPEQVPMNIRLEDVLGPLYDVELGSIMTDFS